MMKFHSLRIVEIQPDADDAVAVSLEVPPELRSEFTGAPGQHVALRAEVNGEPVRRTYSLVSLPGEWPLRIVVRIHENGLLSQYLAAQAKVGDRIDALPPNGSLTARIGGPGLAPGSESGQTFVGFASGCGITSVLSIARALLGAYAGNRFILFYGNTNTARTLCLEELLALKDKHLSRLAIHFLMSREPQEVELYNGRMDAARVRELAGLFQPDRITEYFVSGPGDMIEQVSDTLRELGVPTGRVHVEHFKAAAGASAAGEHSATAADGELVDAGPVTAPDSSTVTVLMDGRRRSFNMRLNDETVLDAAERAGLDLPFSCRAGVCSTCRTKVVAGEVEMAQNYALEEWEVEQGYVLACQSRAKTPTLELDYDAK